MKPKTIFTTLAALACLWATPSCTIETSDNGDLDGYWHLEGIDTLPDGGHADLQEQRLFWSFQHHLMELVDRDRQYDEVILRFSHTDDSLIVSEPRFNDRERGDSAITDVWRIAPYGVNNLRENFEVEKLKGGKMILKSSLLRLNFRKF